MIVPKVAKKVALVTLKAVKTANTKIAASKHNHSQIVWLTKHYQHHSRLS